MLILHTSDWHLGRNLYGRRRQHEFAAFLDWLLDTISANKVDVLLVAGDVFDTTTPGNRAQELYYRFLCRVAQSCCRHVVIVAGNHDSPSFLAAPRELLSVLNVHVVAAVTEDGTDEVLLLRDEHGEAELIVAAVPYLRDSDIRQVQAGESIADKERNLAAAVIDHYAAVAAQAEALRAEVGADVPLIGTGHLFAIGGTAGRDDGMRELYVGSLGHIDVALLPDCFAYLALGHLHSAQTVAGDATRRYSGAPLAMGFGDAGQEKSVTLVEMTAGEITVSSIAVPVFQALERISGDMDSILARIGQLVAADASIWLEVVYSGDAIVGDIRARLDKAVAASAVEILRVKNERVVAQALRQMDEAEVLDDLSVDEVFKRCLDAHQVPKAQREQLLAAFGEAVTAVQEEDRQAQ